MKTRKEFDIIGGINVPNDKYWGQHKDQKNFLISAKYMCQNQS